MKRESGPQRKASWATCRDPTGCLHDSYCRTLDAGVGMVLNNHIIKHFCYDHESDESKCVWGLWFMWT